MKYFYQYEVRPSTTTLSSNEKDKCKYTVTSRIILYYSLKVIVLPFPIIPFLHQKHASFQSTDFKI